MGILRPFSRVSLPGLTLFLRLLPSLNEKADLRSLVRRGVLNLASMVESNLLEILSNFLLNDRGRSFTRKVLSSDERGHLSVPPERSLVPSVRVLRLERLDGGFVLTVVVLVILIHLTAAGAACAAEPHSHHLVHNLVLVRALASEASSLRHSHIQLPIVVQLDCAAAAASSIC